MSRVACKMLSAARIVQLFHKAGNVSWERKTESERDINIVKNWQNLCQKLDAKVKLDDFIHVDNEASATAEVTGDLATT